jgi:hypothetical protein
VVFPAIFFEDALWCDEAVGHGPPKPVWDVNDVVVTFFLVHGGQDLIDLGVDGGVVALCQYRSALA